ncbi:hypothetical protein LLG96_09855 [bacterium]|nr:hypothetical protein [bacterium]
MNRRAHALKTMIIVFLVLQVTFNVIPVYSQAPNTDTRDKTLRDADHFEIRMADVKNRAEWEKRRAEIRDLLLLRAGLWPEPERTPLNARIFDEKKGDGFTVAKVYFESLPGFFATGNLYRPAKGKPPYPAVVCPHGHWQYGRLQNSEAGSIPGRCIDFARMGFVVFSIDMVGYNDSFQLPHDPFKSRAQLKADEPLPYESREMRPDFSFSGADLYGFNLGGVQLWNGIRAVDFLCSLPDVDPSRIGVTGASGGATQTLFLMIADDRVKVAAPVNIIGAKKHPGCLCENIPGLWLDTSTVEMAAAFAPRPLLLMSATEDPWTNSTPTREYPMIQKYYAFYGANDKIKNVHISAGHNYNAETRAAVYDWFCMHLKSQFPAIKNPAPVSPELKALGDLRVFPDRVLPENAVSGWDVIKNWKTSSEQTFSALLPHSADQYNEFRITFHRKLGDVLAAVVPDPDDLTAQKGDVKTIGAYTSQTHFLGRKGKGDCFECEIISAKTTASGTILVICPDSWGDFISLDTGTIQPWIANILSKGYRIARVRGYASGQLAIPLKTWDTFMWPSAYNRDNGLNGIQDIITAMQYCKDTWKKDRLTVLGFGSCGIPAMFACATHGGTDKILADMNGSDPAYDGELARLMPYGAIKRVGDFRTATLLLVNKPLILFNPGPTFDSAWYRAQAGGIGCDRNLLFRSSVNPDNVVDLL